MIRILSLVLVCCVGLSACGSYSMMRHQERLGLINWMSQASKAGALDTVFYNVGSDAEEKEILKVMEGRNYGPSFALQQVKDSGKGLRLVVVKNPAFQTYGDRLCQRPLNNDETLSGTPVRVTMALCYNDTSYAEVRTQSRLDDMDISRPDHPDFASFYAQAFRYLSDPDYEMKELRGNCSSILCK